MSRSDKRREWRAFCKLVGKKNRCTFYEYPEAFAQYHAVTRMGVKYERS